MKKILSFVVVMMLFSISAFAVGENIEQDLSAYTLEELTELRNSIDAEINNRLSDFSSDLIYMGEYVAGVDIKSGTYLLESASDDGFFSFHLYADKDKERDDLICNENLSDGERCYMDLKDGMLLYVYSGKGTVLPWTKPSWAP